jgi:hypothetical protein
MSDQSTHIRRWHDLLLATPLQEVHTQLYEAFPISRGFSSRQRDDALFEAVFSLALFQAAGLGQTVQEVYCFVPSVTQQWFLNHLRESTKVIFGQLRTRNNVKLVEHIGSLFHQLKLGDQPFLLPNEPERWISFGFLKTDAIPEWMSAKLLEVPSRAEGQVSV